MNSECKIETYNLNTKIGTLTAAKICIKSGTDFYEKKLHTDDSLLGKWANLYSNNYHFGVGLPNQLFCDRAHHIDAFVRFVLEVFVYIFRYFNNHILIFGKTETAIQNSFPLHENN